MASILLGIPSYKSDMNIGLLFPMLNATKKHKLEVANTDTSATCFSFNQLWVQALDLWEQGKISHFLMVHSDIVPQNLFIDKMMEIADRCGADILSAIVPIKNTLGLTSTAMDEQVGDEDPRWRVRRVTMREAHAMPKTWTHDKVLLNTGLMLVKMGDWCKQIHFHFDDDIIMYRGKRTPQCFPEDWNLSRDAHKLGVKLYATREVAVTHMGHQGFPNFQPWGSLETDFKNPDPDPIIDAAVEAAGKLAGYMSPNELRWLANQAKDAEVIIELGSWKGRSTKALAMATSGTVYAVDNWGGNSGDDETGIESREKGAAVIRAEFEANLAEEIASGKVRIIDCDHAVAGHELLEQLVGKRADLIFIDGDHTKEAVTRDIMAMKPFVKPGGKLCGHDFSPLEIGVMEAVNENLTDPEVVADSIWCHETALLRLVQDNETVTDSSSAPITSSALENRSTLEPK